MKTRKIVSLFLAVLMACSVFAGLSVSAEETATHTYTVVGKAPFLGAEWTPATPADDMTLREDGTYYKVYENPAAGTYDLKVAEDHAWDVSFGATVDSDANVSVTVPEGTVKLEAILHITGTKEVEVKDKDGNVTGTKTVTAAYVEFLVDGEVPDTTPAPTETFHAVAGDKGLCGAEWDPAAEAGRMTLQADGTYSKTFEGIAPGTYGFKVTTNGKWDVGDYNFQGDAKFGGPNASIEVTEANSTVVIWFDGVRAHASINGVDVTPVVDTSSESKPDATVIDDETSGITYNAGFYTPASDVETKRLYFQMPVNVTAADGTVVNWYTFKNAKATCYWFDGTDNCNGLTGTKDGEKITGWQMSYQMRSAGIENIFYVDLPTDVGTIIFANGIDGGKAPNPETGVVASPNWGKNFQTVNIGTEYYDPNESETYPEGLSTFDKMVYIVDVNKVTDNEFSGAKTYGGEWYFLHEDGKYDTTPGTTWTVPGISVRLDKTTATVAPGKTVTLVPTVTQGNGNTVTWSSDNTDVATVDEKGVVTGVKAGTATIKCTVSNPVADGAAADEDSATCVITVNQPVTSVKLNATSRTIYTGKTFTLKATVAPADATDKTVKWTTSNKNVATVTSKGVVKGVRPGTATITATCGGKKATCRFTVKQLVTSVRLNRTSAVIYSGKTVTLKATVYPRNASNRTVAWTTLNRKVATVTSRGVVKGIKGGTTYVRATARDGSRKYAQCRVTVRQSATKITLSKTKFTLKKGKTQSVKATLYPSNVYNKKISVKASNKNVKLSASTITSKKSVKITGKKKGKSTVTFSAKDGSKKSAKCTVTVK